MFKDAVDYIKKNYWLLILVIGVPITINYLLLWWHFPGVTGDYGDWLGFFSNYSGGIIGGIVAFVIAKYQIENEKQERLREDKEKEKLGYDIVETFLYEELRRNLNLISPGIVEALQKQANGNLNQTYITGSQNKYDYEVFNQIKFELLKYNNQIVRETIQVYKNLKRFESVTEINKLSPEHAKNYYTDFYMWKGRLEE